MKKLLIAALLTLAGCATTPPVGGPPPADTPAECKHCTNADGSQK